VDITRYLEARARAAEGRERQLLQQAVRVPAEPFVTLELTREAIDAESTVIDDDPPQEELESKAETPQEPVDHSPRSLVRRLGWPDRWQR
jgi:hypothetical protein